MTASDDLRSFLDGACFGTVLADPPWRFTNRTGKVAPEHRRLARYPTLTLDEICDLPVADHLSDVAHCYMWVPNALLPEGLQVLAAWGFAYKSNIVWHKIRKDGGSDGRGVGFYFRNVTELLLFGTRGRECPHAAAGPQPGEHAADPQARAFPQAGRTVRPDPELFGRPLPGTFRPRRAQGLDRLGQPERPRTTNPTWKTYAYNSSLAAE